MCLSKLLLEPFPYGKGQEISLSKMWFQKAVSLGEKGLPMMWNNKMLTWGQLWTGSEGNVICSLWTITGKLEDGKFSITHTYTFKVLCCSFCHMVVACILSCLYPYFSSSQQLVIIVLTMTLIVFVNHYWIKTFNHNALVRAIKTIFKIKKKNNAFPAILNDDQLSHEAKGNYCCCSTILLYRIATLLHKRKKGHFNW